VTSRSLTPCSTTLLPFISIVVPVRNEARHIGDTLAMLLAQDYPPTHYEILVVDGMSTDGTRQVVEQYIADGAPVSLLPNPRIWSSAARNVGARAARGDYVVVIDGHCELPDSHHLQALVHAFDTSEADIIGRPQPLTVRNANRCQRAIALARASRLGHHPDSYIYSAKDQYVPAQSVGAAYRRHVFDRIGYFDEQFDACEDVDFNYRADREGLRCFLATKARVHYYPRSSLRTLFRQLSRYGRGRIRLARKHPGTCGWKSFAPAVFVIWMVIATFAAMFGGWGVYVLAASLVVYLGAIVLESGRLMVTHRVGLAGLWLPFVFITIHVAAGVGLLHELLLGPRRIATHDDSSKQPAHSS
jgi:succinoglycan biosynthesis protein ExoA